ncbi:MAG: hypothetical protein ACK41Y_15925 [Paracoccus hibiscisoli]|uniref:hypothetical protein n=1 Tax=Paracoccus hibiscisoli TaxID=2023261 RepID=UPI00391C044C
MAALLTLDACLSQALSGTTAVVPDRLDPARATGHALASDLTLPHDLPVRSQALRTGIAVASLDTVGASPQLPLPIPAVMRVQAGCDLPPGMDAVLALDDVDLSGPVPQVIRPIGPGEGMRRAGHDGRAEQPLAQAGDRLGALTALLAAEAGLETVPVRRPRVRIALDDLGHAGFAARWTLALGGLPSDDAPHMVLRTDRDALPRLALTGAETAWLSCHDGVLILDLPPRFDAMIVGLLALGRPALAALTGSTARPLMRPLTRKVASAPGMADLVLLAAHGDGWRPGAPGLITLAALTQAQAFAILPPDSEGLPAGAPLAGTPVISLAHEMP